MKVKNSDGKVRAFTINRWRYGIYGYNYVTCMECGKEWELAKCTAVKDMREEVEDHCCKAGEMNDE